MSAIQSPESAEYPWLILQSKISLRKQSDIISQKIRWQKRHNFIIPLFPQITPKDECVVALTKMSNCPACQGLPKIRPCEDYCINVMKGCLAYHAELGESWDKFIGKCLQNDQEIAWLFLDLENKNARSCGFFPTPPSHDPCLLSLRNYNFISVGIRTNTSLSTLDRIPTEPILKIPYEAAEIPLYQTDS